MGMLWNWCRVMACICKPSEPNRFWIDFLQDADVQLTKNVMQMYLQVQHKMGNDEQKEADIILRDLGEEVVHCYTFEPLKTNIKLMMSCLKPQGSAKDSS